ncbi:MAG: tyrosine-type recombinase/integrase [Candidatus Heimdallarchaeota archaeon]|nr:tyrosine-type recombinase/integrase [Candidatus Heimdallarchaeota archaeon]
MQNMNNKSTEDKDFFIDSFLSYLTIERGSSENTIKGYSHDLYTLKSFIIDNVLGTNNFDWSELKIIHLRSFLSHLYNGRSNKTASIHRRVCSIKAFYRYMSDNEMVENDPAKDLKYPKRPSSMPKFLEVDHIQRLFQNTKNPTHRVILEVLYSTGMRVNELRNVNLEDLNLKERNIVIRSGKGNKDRIVLLSERATEVLANYIATAREETLAKAASKKPLGPDSEKAVFLSNRGKRIANRTIQHFISELSKDIGVKHTTPHMLRHSFASHLVMNNTNIRVVQKLLGHASLDTTQIYANISDDFMKKEFDNSLPLR